MSWRRSSPSTTLATRLVTRLSGTSRIFLAVLIAVAGIRSAGAETLNEQRELLYDSLRKTHQLEEAELRQIKTIFGQSRVLGQGNPAISEHPYSKAECRRVRREKVQVDRQRERTFEQICGDRHMAPLFDPETELPAKARACIDQYEFPNIPCEYPVVWVRANEAAALCSAVGKRLCDAHEWEGACAGRLLAPDYAFDSREDIAVAYRLRAMRISHNEKWSPQRRWSYGVTARNGICAMNSTKSSACNGGDWQRCGSNTYPAGMFPECSSPLGGYDFHGNAAEHMNLPANKQQMASSASGQLGHTEMKGSWFIWDRFPAHPDWCRWRAPYWHGTRISSERSHRNYHLGFRCCKSLPTADAS